MSLTSIIPGEPGSLGLQPQVIHPMTQLTFHAGAGIPGAGKSTYLRALHTANPTWAYISPDHCRAEICGGREEDQSKDGFIWKTLIPTRIVGASARHEHVLFDATLVHRKARKQILGFAKETGYRIILHVMRTPFTVCRQRNAARSRVVPDWVLDRMEAKWQEPDLALEPYIDEIVNVSYIP